MDLSQKKTSPFPTPHTMARELGMNPKGFCKLDNHKQERWKAPLPQFIEELYFKRFKKEASDTVYSFEQLTKLKNKKKAEEKANKVLKSKSINTLPTSVISKTESVPSDLT